MRRLNRRNYKLRGNVVHTVTLRAESALRLLLERVTLSEEADEEAGHPIWSDETGRWKRSAADHWASGYGTGMCWLARTVGLRAPKQGRVAPVEVPAAVIPSSFHAFVAYYGGHLGGALFDDPDARRESMRVAGLLADALLPAGALTVEEEDLRPENAARAFAYIDATGPASVLLASYGRAERTVKSTELGARHAFWTLDALQRQDGSVFQVVELARQSGRIRRAFTGAQGVHGSSRWARAQAWGLLAAALAQPLGAGTELDVGHMGRRLADWWLSHSPQDAPPPWDFDASASDGVVDTSAGAIAAASLLRLSAQEEQQGRRRAYRQAAETQIEALLTRVTPQSRRDRRPPGMLLDGCYHLPRGLAPSNELIWGSYYLSEALAMLTGAVTADMLDAL
jgi:unsaturated chondroitin disaccharide hydrolase